MPKLLCAALDDGIGFVSDDGRLWLVKPPYRSGNTTRTDEATLFRAFADPGFEALESDFVDWAGLVSFLRSRFLERAGRLPPSSGIAGRELLRHAPRSVLERYFSRIERELLPAGEWQAAQGLLVAMIGIDSIRLDAELHARAQELLVRCNQVASGRYKLAGTHAFDVVELEKCFPHVANAAEVVELARKVAERGQLLRPTG